jgi:hypothetical protein
VLPPSRPADAVTRHRQPRHRDRPWGTAASPAEAPAGLSGGEAGDRCWCAGDCGVPRPRWGGRLVTRAMCRDHALVLDHGIPGACPPARLSVITRRTMITAFRAAAAQRTAVPARPALPARPPRALNHGHPSRPSYLVTRLDRNLPRSLHSRSPNSAPTNDNMATRTQPRVRSLASPRAREPASPRARQPASPSARQPASPPARIAPRDSAGTSPAKAAELPPKPLSSRQCRRAARWDRRAGSLAGAVRAMAGQIRAAGTMKWPSVRRLSSLHRSLLACPPATPIS